MTEQERLFFKQIEEKSKENPMIRIQAASDYITGFLKQSFTTDKGIQGDMWCYLLATMTGIAAAKASKETYKELMVINLNNQIQIPLTKLETEMGTFWIGDSLNRYIYNSPLSVWNIVMTFYSQKHKDKKLPDLNKALENNSKAIGKSDARVWDGTHNPYEEIENAKNTYDNLRKQLEPYKLEKSEYPSVFAMSLAKVILGVEGIFPKKLNCLEISMQTMMFYAHMD